MIFFKDMMIIYSLLEIKILVQIDEVSFCKFCKMKDQKYITNGSTNLPLPLMLNKLKQYS